MRRGNGAVGLCGSGKICNFVGDMIGVFLWRFSGTLKWLCVVLLHNRGEIVGVTRWFLGVYGR